MSQRESNLLWLRDLLEQMESCRQQMEWAKDGEAVQVLTENMLRDVETCRRLCESLRQRVRGLQHAA
jgi:hypothetical protein